MINMIGGLKRYFHTFILSTKGSIAIMFVFMIPMFFAFIAYYFDSVQLSAKEARLADAVDEGTLAISSRGWGKDKNKENVDTVNLYLHNYLPEAKRFTNIKVDQNDPNSECMNRYRVSANAEIKMLFHYDNIPSFSLTEWVSANSKACLRGSKASFVGDFAFLIDLSSSMRCVMSASSQFKSCKDNAVGTELEETAKLTKLKEVVTQMIVEIMENSEQSEFALVPFNIGVPVKLNGKNERGGELFGCSVAFTPKADFDIDYGYWANKYIPPDTKSISEAVSAVDNARFTYYNNYVIDKPSDLDRYCTQNDPSLVQKNKGQALRSCMSDLSYNYVKDAKVGSQEWYNNNTMLYYDGNNDNIYRCVDSSADWATCVESLLTPAVSRKLHPTFTSEWKRARDVRQTASKLDPDMSEYEKRKCTPTNKRNCWSMTEQEYRNRHLLYRNIANDESVDYEKTLEDMFKKTSIRTFAMPWVYRQNYVDTDLSTKTLRPYHWMCPSIPGGDSGSGSSQLPESVGMPKMKETMPYASMNHYLIDLTRFCGTNRFTKKSLGACDGTKVDLKVIEGISVGNGVRTDTITGLLRTVPVIAESKNNFKSIIIVSDGADNVNLTLSDKMLNQYKICDRIRDGFKKLNYEVGLYMIFTYTPEANTGKEDEEIAKHIALWTNCVGEDNFYYANTIDKLQTAIKDILKKTSTKQPSEMASFVYDD